MGRSAGVARWRHNGTRIDLRQIDSVQVVFNVSGGHSVELTSAAGSVAQTVDAGSIALVSRGSPATVNVCGAADVLQFAIDGRRFPNLAGRRKRSGSVLTNAARSACSIAAVRALVALERDEDRSSPALRRLVESVAWSIAQPFRDVADEPERSPLVRRRVSDFVEARLTSGRMPTTAEMAGIAGYSADHFAALFRRCEGSTPHSYVNGRRLDRAITMLLSTDMRLSEIGDSLGFGSPSHFTSAFHTFAGVTPGAVRAAARR